MMSPEARKILIVDAEPDTVMLVESRLKANGYLVLTAGDGEAGLEMARKESPHLILLDFMLPKIDGLKICSLLKSDPQYAGIPIILFTAKAQKKDIQLGSEAGVDAYLTKPVSPEILLKTIQKMLPQMGVQK